MDGEGEQPPQQQVDENQAEATAAQDAGQPEPAADMEGMVQGMDGEMEGMDGAVDDMEGMDGEMEGMDGEMEGDADAPLVDMDGNPIDMEEEEEVKVEEVDKDYSKDPRIQWMLKFLDEIMNYKAEEEATAPTNERLSQFVAFLDKPDYSKFFVWVDFNEHYLRWSFERCPQFYEAEPKIKVQDY